MKIDRDTLTPDGEIELLRENGRRLAAALILLRGTIDERNGDSHLHVVVAPRSGITVADVIDGALELHEQLRKGLDQ